MAPKKTFEFFFGPLLKKFFQDMGRDPNNLEMILLRQKAGQQLKDSTKVIEFPQKESFMKQVEAMKRSGDIVDPNNLKKNDNVLTSELFQNSNLNKVALDRDRAIKAKARIKEKNSVTETVSYIKTLEPMDAMKEANSVIGRKGKYKNLTPEESKKILQDTEDHIFERDIPDEDFAKGGRAGYAVGNQVMPAIDQRMNLDYNTLVDQNTAQRGFMDNWRNHAIATQAMRGKVSGTGLKDGETIPNYGMQSGYDFKKNFKGSLNTSGNQVVPPSLEPVTGMAL